MFSHCNDATLTGAGRSSAGGQSLADRVTTKFAGFPGYISRETSIDGLYTAGKDISLGKVACPPEITGGLLRALFRQGRQSEESLSDPVLTRREREVLDLIGQGRSNKEIGTHLCLSVATVKHHVHNLFEKLGLTRRADAMRRVRDAPWLSRVASGGSGE